MNIEEIRELLTEALEKLEELDDNTERTVIDGVRLPEPPTTHGVPIKISTGKNVYDGGYYKLACDLNVLMITGDNCWLDLDGYNISKLQMCGTHMSIENGTIHELAATCDEFSVSDANIVRARFVNCHHVACNNLLVRDTLRLEDCSDVVLEGVDGTVEQNKCERIVEK